jgi:hypothetical protein
LEVAEDPDAVGRSASMGICSRKPKGMHWRTYDRLRRLNDAAEQRSMVGLMGFVERRGRRTSRRA